tara:strand:- start:152 stop:475 length:324 start_codon:yes stop_codon:yes gene_type:complete
MIFNHQRITSAGTDTKTLSTAEHGSSEKLFTVERLLVSNTDSTDVTVNLWLYDGSAIVGYILKATTVPVGTTLDVFDGVPFSYPANNSLLLNLGDAGHTADVIFNRY